MPVVLIIGFLSLFVHSDDMSVAQGFLMMFDPEGLLRLLTPRELEVVHQNLVLNLCSLILA